KVLSFSTDSSVAGNGVWLTGFLPEMEAKRILAFARSQGRGQVGVFHPANGYGEAALRGARAAERAGLTQIIGSGAFQPGFQGVQAASSGFAAEARGADAILLATGGRDLQAAGSFMNLNDFDPARVKYLGLGQWYSGATFQELSLQNGWFPAPDVGRSNQFSDRYARQFGAKPRLVAVLGYDAVRVAGQVFAEARRGGSTDPFPTQILTRPAGFEGGIGAIRFNQAGLSERALAVLEVSDRSFRTIDPAPARFRAGF
ncbi:MAG: ABC transporter substrate-binding protein, partial [Pseudomonadota bacterium]